MEKFVVLMSARSWSGMSQPGTRPVKAAFVPRMYSVQSPWLSSIQRPAPFRFTIRLTRGGGFVIAGLIAGTKFVPLLGGGFFPPDGASGKLIGLGRGNPCDTPVPMIVEALPDSNTATYTVEPSGLTSMALGRFPSMTRFVTTCKVEVLKTWTRFGWPQDTYARAGVPAKTMSDGSFEVTSVFTTRAVSRST